MHIEKESPDSFMVELTQGELGSFQLTYQQLTYQNPKTRHLLKFLLNHAGEMVGFYKGEEKLLVEVYPAPLKGCVIYFTKLHPKGKRYRKKTIHIYAFATCEELLQGAALFQTPPPQSEAYLLGQEYLLILHGKPAHGLTEFATRVTPTKHLLAHIREHGKLLAEAKAVERLQGHPV